MMTYPDTAGWKEPTTSREAAKSVRPHAIREDVWWTVYMSGGMTADEVAEHLELSVLTVRPRCSELIADGRLIDSGLRRRNASGRRAMVLLTADD